MQRQKPLRLLKRLKMLDSRLNSRKPKQLRKLKKLLSKLNMKLQRRQCKKKLKL